MRKTKYDEKAREDIRGLYEKGLSMRQIAEMYRADPKTIEKVLSEFGYQKTSHKVVRKQSEISDTKLQDIIAYNKWKESAYEQLEREKTYNKMPLIQLSKYGFTYRHKNGYNEYISFIELYPKNRVKSSY
ncbi:MAG: hypothetical protein ACRCX8_09855 [Sarcina sp.]